MEYHEQYIEYLVKKGGPDATDYAGLDAWIHEISDQLHDGILTQEDKSRLLSKFGDAFSKKTMQGFAYKKPYGYAGDVLNFLLQKGRCSFKPGA